MKILKIALGLLIIFSVFTACSPDSFKGDYKIQLLLEPLNNEKPDIQTINKTIEIQRKRLELYGVRKDNIKTELKGNSIFIEVNEINNPERVVKLLTQQGKIEFWETYKFPEVYDYFYSANEKLRELNYVIKKNMAVVDTSEKDLSEDNLLLNDDTNLLLNTNDESPISDETEGLKEFQEQNPFFALLIPYLNNQNQPIESATVGYSNSKDTAEVNIILKMVQVKAIFPQNMVFAWEAKPMDIPMKPNNNTEEINEEIYYSLIALKAERAGKPALEGDVIINAKEEVGLMNSDWEVSMTMNEIGTSKWAFITRKNIGKQIAIVMDGSVYSAPNVNSEITGGKSSISGNFTHEEASDMALMLNVNSLPYKLKILKKEIIKIK